MKRSVNLLIFLFLLTHFFSIGQIDQFQYKCELKGINEQWHRIPLPDEIFGNVTQRLSDIRIYGITENKDTIEAPYLLKLKRGSVSSKDVAFKRLNASYNARGYYFTFEVPTSEAINQIKLEFDQQNFDWRVKLEGSQNQQEWFTVLDNYRILSIKNELSDFQFTLLKFPNSKYRFFRLVINSKEKPNLVLASISNQDLTEGTYRKYPIQQTHSLENKQTKVDVDLLLPVPLSRITIDVKDTFDYYRPITIQYLVDSFETEQGWKYNYQPLTSGTINSLEANEFNFSSKIVQKLKIQISNQDNQALTIGAVEAKGYVHELVARFTEPATYYLVYGNKDIGSPDYDINRFTSKIPETLSALEIGDTEMMSKEELADGSPLFQNSVWLWAVMIMIILVLGWFTLNMIKQK